MRQQGVMNGLEFMGGLAFPERKCGSVSLNALPRIDSRLAVQQVLGVFGDDHAGDGCLGRCAAFDQPWLGRCLDNPSFADRQAYLGRRVTMTRNWAGTMSSRSLTSSPMMWRSATQPQVTSSGTIASSMRSMCFGKTPRFDAPVYPFTIQHDRVLPKRLIDLVEGNHCRAWCHVGFVKKRQRAVFDWQQIIQHDACFGEPVVCQNTFRPSPGGLSATLGLVGSTPWCVPCNQLHEMWHDGQRLKKA